MKDLFFDYRLGLEKCAIALSGIHIHYIKNTCDILHGLNIMMMN